MWYCRECAFLGDESENCDCISLEDAQVVRKLLSEHRDMVVHAVPYAMGVTDDEREIYENFIKRRD